MNDNWKPDPSKENPFEDMPADYAGISSFLPTEAQPLPAWEIYWQQHSDTEPDWHKVSDAKETFTFPTNVLSMVDNTLSTIKETNTGAWQTIIDWIDERLNAFLKSVASPFTEAIDWIKNIFSNIGEWFTSIFLNIRDWFTQLFESVTGVMRELIASLKDWLSRGLESIKTTYNNILASIKEGWESLVVKLSDIYTSTIQDIKDWLGNMMKNIEQGLSVGFTYLADRLEDLMAIPATTLFNLIRDVFFKEIID